jgi:hypothetical protein
MRSQTARLSWERFIRQITQEGSLKLRHKRLLRIYALMRGKILRTQCAEPLQIELCIGK